MPSPAPTLVCKQCNFENEPERVYCHNCGAKLDRSLLPADATKREDPVLVQDRLRKMTNPRRGAGLRFLKSLVLSLLIGAVLAFVIEVVLPPEGRPNLTPEEVDNSRMISDEMDNALQTPGAHKLVFNAKQVNAFLKYSIKGKEESVLGFIPVKFERTFVQFDEGVCRVFMEQSIFGYSLYANGAYEVKIQGGKLESRNVGGGLGRLRLPALISARMDPIFSRLWKVLGNDQKLLAQMQSVAFHKDAVEMVSNPAAR
jgi:hypothetical protein